jgi:cytochrome c55X
MDSHHSARAVPGRCAVAIAAVIAMAAPTRSHADAVRPLSDEQIASTWRTLRMVDCARCHGKDYEGLAAPSIIDYARTQSREMFARIVLDGDPPRGMPAYRDNPKISGHIDEIYRYFVGRANGTIRAGSPVPLTEPQPQPK